MAEDVVLKLIQVKRSESLKKLRGFQLIVYIRSKARNI